MREDDYMDAAKEDIESRLMTAAGACPQCDCLPCGCEKIQAILRGRDRFCGGKVMPIPEINIGDKLKKAPRIKVCGLKPREVYTVTAIQVPKYGNEPMPYGHRLAEGWWWVQTDKTGDEWYALCRFVEVS